MSFTGNRAPEEYIEVLQERIMERLDKRGLTPKGKPLVFGRSILEPIDYEAKKRAEEGREQIRTASGWKKQVIKTKEGEEGIIVEREKNARDMCGEGGYVYTPHSPRIRWQKFPIPYYVDVSSAPVTDKIAVDVAIDKAFNEYNRVYRQIKNSTTVLMFKRTMDPVLAKVKVQWQYLDGALRNLGRCYYSWWTTLPIGEMRSASVNFDTSDKWFVSSVERCGYSGLYFDIQNIAAHEIGHACGLAHNGVDALATMYPSSKAGETLDRTLGNADIKALTELYK